MTAISNLSKPRHSSSDKANSLFWILMIIGLLGANAAGASTFNAYFQSTPDPNEGNFTLSWNQPPGRVWLQEKPESGTWTSIAGWQSLSSPMQFTNKPDGLYEYRLRWDEYVCTGSGRRRNCNYVTRYSGVESLRAGLTPKPESLAAQRLYEFQIRTGDFDGNGYDDVLIDRLTAGPVDGTMQSVIVKGYLSGPLASAPTSNELVTARSFPLNSSIKAGGNDTNTDGFLDIMLTGLSQLYDAAYPYDCLIVYAPGVAFNAEPLGSKFIDEEYTEFFSSVANGVADSSFFPNNTQVTVTPVFETDILCPFQFGNGFSWSLWNCSLTVDFVGFETQITGIGFHPDAPDAVDALNLIASDSHSTGDPWKTLSDTLQRIIGVPSFGFQFNGTRVAMNFRNSDEDIENDDIDNAEQQFLFNLTLGLDLTAPLPQNWPRHEYDTENEICNTFGSTVFTKTQPGLGSPRVFGTKVYSIPAAVCSLQNVYCWQRRRPAPRADDSDDSIVDEQFEESELQGWPSTNPIVTHTFPGSNVIVNETITGHVLHDPLATFLCGSSDDIDTLNTRNGGRCAYVHRQSVHENGVISIKTHGEGHNPNAAVKKLNEVVGRRIFNGVDDWIRVKLATVGACPLSD